MKSLVPLCRLLQRVILVYLDTIAWHYSISLSCPPLCSTRQTSALQATTSSARYSTWLRPPWLIIVIGCPTGITLRQTVKLNNHPHPSPCAFGLADFDFSDDEKQRGQSRHHLKDFFISLSLISSLLLTHTTRKTPLTAATRGISTHLLPICISLDPDLSSPTSP
jgi:hypothetical protein